VTWAYHLLAALLGGIIALGSGAIVAALVARFLGA